MTNRLFANLLAGIRGIIIISLVISLPEWQAGGCIGSM